MSLIVCFLITRAHHQEPKVEFPPRIYSAREIARQFTSEDRTVRFDDRLAERAWFLALKPRPWAECHQLLTKTVDLEIVKEGNPEKYVLRETKQAIDRRLDMQRQFSKVLYTDVQAAWAEDGSAGLRSENVPNLWKRFLEMPTVESLRSLRSGITFNAAMTSNNASPQLRRLVKRTLNNLSIPNLVQTPCTFTVLPMENLVLPELEGKSPCNELGINIRLFRNRRYLRFTFQAFAFGGESRFIGDLGSATVLYELARDGGIGPEEYFLGGYVPQKPEAAVMGKVASEQFQQYRAEAEEFWRSSAGKLMDRLLKLNRHRTVLDMLGGFLSAHKDSEFAVPLEGPSTVDLEMNDIASFEAADAEGLPYSIGKQGLSLASWLPSLVDDVTTFKNPLAFIDTQLCPPLASSISLLNPDFTLRQDLAKTPMEVLLKYFEKTTNRRRDWAESTGLFTRHTLLERSREALTYADKLLGREALVDTKDLLETYHSKDLNLSFLAGSLSKRVTSNVDLMKYFTPSDQDSALGIRRYKQDNNRIFQSPYAWVALGVNFLWEGSIRSVMKAPRPSSDGVRVRDEAKSVQIKELPTQG
ncbi:MAG: hypothetical protein ABL949_00840 [Fimbriimonadaceae bacterium]